MVGIEGLVHFYAHLICNNPFGGNLFNYIQIETLQGLGLGA